MPTCRAVDKGSTGNYWRRSALREIVPPVRRRSLEQQVADQFASFATTIQTRLDGNGAMNGSFGGSIEVQVGRALAQVLRTPAAGGAAIGAAVLPVATPGALAGPVLPPRQEVLRQEGRLIVDAVSPLVSRSQPIVPNQQAPSDVELYRASIQYELDALVWEFGRPDGPRVPTVRVLLGALLGWDPRRRQQHDVGDIEIFTLLLQGGLVVQTRALEEMDAAVGLLITAGGALLAAWEQYAGNEESDQLWGRAQAERRLDLPPAEPSFAERMRRAAELTEVIAQDVALITGSLDAISFGFAERQTVELELHTWVDADLLGGESLKRVVTVGDILDWADALATRTAGALETTGQLGLNLLADEADEVFWLIEAMYGPLSPQDRFAEVSAEAASTDDIEDLYRPPSDVPQELSDAQVRRAFLSLARDLDELADLAVAIRAPYAGYTREASTR